MDEVSGRFAKWVYESGLRDGVDEPALLAGVSVAAEELGRGRGRISWGDYIQMLENYHGAVGLEGMRKSALEFGTTQELAVFSKVAGLFLSPKNIYRFMLRWSGNHFLRNVEFGFDSNPDGSYRVGASIDKASRGSQVFFQTLSNVLAGAPCRIGRPPAEVEIPQIGSHQAEFRISPPRPASIGWYLMWPFRAVASIPAHRRLFAQQQEEIKTTHGAVARQREDFRAMVERISDSLLILDSEGKALFANAATREIFGLLTSDVEGWIPASAMDADHHAAWGDFLSSEPGSGEREFPFRNSDGGETMLSFGLPNRTQFNQAEALMLVGRDVTQAREVEARLREVAFGERRRIAGDLHDGLGQVLTGINWQANLLASQLDAGGDHDATAKARAIAELAIESTRQARDLAHGLAGIDELADNLRRALVEHVRKTEHEFGLDISLDLPPADERLSAPGEVALEVLRIVQEATHNAIKHAESTLLQISVITEPKLWRVVVADRGKGMVDGAEASGSGLGIRSMQYRAAALGGKVELTPRAGGGMRLQLTIPPQEISTPSPQRRGSSPTPTAALREGAIRVAVADDHETVLQGIVALLGAETDLEICGQTGARGEIIPLVTAENPDVLVMDMLMDGDDNLETIARLREAMPGLRIVVLSMFHQEQYGEAAKNAGADAYVMKQAPPADLVAEVRAV